MKKLIILAMAAMLTACAGGAPASQSSASNSGGGLITVGFAQVGAESGWRTANTDSFKSYFTEANGFNLIFSDAQQDQNKQIAAVRDFITQGVDYIDIAPVTTTGWETVLQEAKDAGIPVIISDRKADVSDDLYVTYIGGNFEQEGSDAIKWLEGYLAENNRSDDELNIVHLQGTIGADAQIGRTKALDTAVSGPHADKWSIIAQQTGEFTEARGQEVMEAILKNNTKVDVVYSENDDMTYGAITALKNAGIDHKDVIIISFDGNKKAIQMIIDADIDCVAECNPLLGPQVGDIIKKIEAGDTLPKVTYSIESVYDIKNAEAHLPDAFGS
ncbi:MAG: ABC transporter substrate-binding protein [Clostridiales bacterium]|jgi:simple sugar transport system substrate-binding protein|nr:ABC transporter substrate-binding protein [Clostridiales bacterium]